MKLYIIVEPIYKLTNWRHFTLQLCPLISYYRNAKLKRSFFNRFIFIHCVQMLYGAFFMVRLFRLAFLIETHAPADEMLISVDPFFAVMISKSTFLQYPHSVTSCAGVSIFIVYIMYIVAFGLPLATMDIFYNLISLNCRGFLHLNRTVRWYLCSLQFNSLWELKKALVDAVWYLWRNYLLQYRTVRFALKQLPGFPAFLADFRLKLLTIIWAAEAIGIAINLVGG